MELFNVHFQVAVLHDQVGAQKEKIRDLETQLDSKRKLYSYEALTNVSPKFAIRFSAGGSKTHLYFRLKKTNSSSWRGRHKTSVPRHFKFVWLGGLHADAFVIPSRIGFGFLQCLFLAMTITFL
jgi:hypothetical protein